MAMRQATSSQIQRQQLLAVSDVERRLVDDAVQQRVERVTDGQREMVRAAMVSASRRHRQGGTAPR